MTEEVFGSFSLNEILAKIPVSVLWTVLLVFAALSLIMALALFFHWRKYTLYKGAMNATETAYIVGLAALFVLCGGSLIFFGG